MDYKGEHRAVRLCPGQYHDIFRIYIDDIFQKNTTKPTIVLPTNKFTFSKKNLKNNFPKKKLSTKLCQRMGHYTLNTVLYVTLLKFLEYTSSAFSVALRAMSYFDLLSFNYIRNHDNVVIFKYLMKFTHIFTCISARKM